MRTSIRFTAFALLVLIGVTCTDGPTSPNGKGGPAFINIVPSFSVQAASTLRDLSSFGLAVDNIHIHIDHPPAEPFDTMIVVPAGADSLVLNLPVILNSPTEQLNVHIELRHGDQVLYSGTQTVTATVGATTSSGAAIVPISYVGPGANLAHFGIAPRDTAILISGIVPYRITATDASGGAVAGVTVHWTLANASLGAISASGVFTPSGTPGKTLVTASTPNGLRDSTSLTVSAPPARLALVSGGDQSSAAGTALASPVVVQVQAASGAGVPGITVSFAGKSGGATVSPASGVTDSSGNARTTVTLGHAAGAQSIVASSSGVPDLAINETATAAAAAQLAKVSGDAQVDTIGAKLPQPFVVKVTDSFGNAVAGATVAWTNVGGDGALAAASTTTDTSGLASMTFTLGPTVRTDSVSASLSDVSGATVLFTATAAPRVATKIAIVSGDAQAGLVGSTLPAPLVVRVTDAGNIPIRGASVTWAVLTGDGTVNPSVSTSDSLGLASTVLTLAHTPGLNMVSATLPNHASVTFTDTSSVGSATSVRFVTQPSNVVSATYIVPNIQVEILDASGHRDTVGAGSTLQVTLSVLHGPPGGTVRDSVGPAAATVSAVAGLATFHVGNDLIGTYKLRASSPGLVSDSSVAYTVSLGPARHVQYVAGAGQTGAPGDTTIVRPQVLVMDGGGNPVPGGSVTWRVDSGGGTLVNPASPTTPASSVVAAADGTGHSAVLWTLGTAGAQQIRAFTTTSSKDTVPFTALLHLVGTQLVFTNVFDTTYASGTHLPLVVQVEDANGHPVPQAGVPVEIYISGLCEGVCDRVPAGSRAAAMRGARPVRAPRLSLAPPRMPAPGVSPRGVITFNRGPAPALAPMAARARGMSGPSRSVSRDAVAFGSGVFPTLPVVPYPTLIGDTVVMTDSTGRAVFANLEAAGMAGPYNSFYIQAYDTLYTTTLNYAWSPYFYLTPGAPYKVFVTYDSVHQAAGNAMVDIPEAAVLDSVGNGVPGVTMTFSVVSGGGSLDSTHAVTDLNGAAAAPGWQLGAASGVNTVHASAAVSGTPSGVDLTAIGHQPAALRMTTDLTGSLLDSTTITPTLAVAVTDSTKTWDLNAGGIAITPAAVLVPFQDAMSPTLIGNTSAVTTSPSGGASFIGLGLYGQVGTTVAVVFSASSLSADTSAVVSIATGPAANIAPVPGEQLDSTHTVGAATREVQVLVTDAAGYRVTGVPVTFTIQNSSANLCTLPNLGTVYTMPTAANGIAAVQVTLPAGAASCVIQATAYAPSLALLSGAPVTFQEVVAPPSYDVWTGASDTTWTNPGNWSSGAVPTQTTSVFIPYAATAGGHYPALAAAASVNSLAVENGTRFELHNNPIYVYGNLDGSALVPDAWSSLGGGSGYVEMMTAGTTIAQSFPYKLAIGDATMSCAGWATAPVTVVGLDSAAAVDVNCPLMFATIGNNWLTSLGDVNVQHHGTLVMPAGSEWLYVKGNLNITSDQSSNGLLTGGSIQVYGNFVEDTVAGAAASATNFYSTGTSMRMQSSPYGPGTPQTIRFASAQAQLWDLYAANPSSSVALDATASASYTIVGGFSIGTGTGNVAFTIPTGITLNVGSLTLGSTGHLYVNGTFHSGADCSSLTLPFITRGANGAITPASCYVP